MPRGLAHVVLLCVVSLGASQNTVTTKYTFIHRSGLAPFQRALNAPFAICAWLNGMITHPNVSQMALLLRHGYPEDPSEIDAAATLTIAGKLHILGIFLRVKSFPESGPIHGVEMRVGAVEECKQQAEDLVAGKSLISGQCLPQTNVRGNGTDYYNMELAWRSAMAAGFHMQEVVDRLAAGGRSPFMLTLEEAVASLPQSSPDADRSARGSTPNMVIAVTDDFELYTISRFSYPPAVPEPWPAFVEGALWYTEDSNDGNTRRFAQDHFISNMTGADWLEVG